MNRFKLILIVFSLILMGYTAAWLNYGNHAHWSISGAKAYLETTGSVENVYYNHQFIGFTYIDNTGTISKYEEKCITTCGNHMIVEVIH